MEQHESSRPTDKRSLEQIVDAGDIERAAAYLGSLSVGEMARVLSRLDDEDRARLLVGLGPDEAAELLQQLPDVHAVELLEELPTKTAAGIMDSLPSDEQADLLADLDREVADAILTEMEPAAAADLRSLAQYPDDVAGGLMIREFLAYPHYCTVSQVIDDLRTHADTYRDYQVQYAYVTDPHEHLIGVLRMRDLLLAPPSRVISGLMIRDPFTVSDMASLDSLRDLLEKHSFFGVPVIDQNRRLLGVVRRAAVMEALADRDVDDFRKAQGIVREELRTMPMLVRSRRRLAWLSVNILLNVLAASVIAVYQDVIEQVITLAVFLPIISDMSGCSGNQAVAVSMRELSLGLVRPSELFRVLWQEFGVGVINGLALGLLLGLAVWLWKGNPWLGGVVGGALALNTLVAVSIGGTLPLLIRRLRLDPALASGPILTTVTDMCGFFLVLNLAALALSRLSG
jgi:magnesium transporter